MIRLSCLWPVTIIVSALAVGYMMFGDITSPLRPLMAFWFLVICPGMALVRLLRISDLMIELTLAVALSFALDAIVASVMVYAGAWSPEWGLAMLLVVSLGGATVQLLRDCRPSFSTMRGT
jgi:hypothetical protein